MAYVACNFSYRVETERLLKVTDSHVHWKKWKYLASGTRWRRFLYRPLLWPIESRHFQWPWATFHVIRRPQTFSTAHCSHSCAAADKISTDLTRRAVPLQYLTFLSIGSSNIVCLVQDADYYAFSDFDRRRTKPSKGRKNSPVFNET